MIRNEKCLFLLLFFRYSFLWKVLNGFQWFSLILYFTEIFSKKYLFLEVDCSNTDSVLHKIFFRDLALQILRKQRSKIIDFVDQQRRIALQACTRFTKKAIFGFFRLSKNNLLYLQSMLDFWRNDHQLGTGHSSVDSFDKDARSDGVGHRPETRPLIGATSPGSCLLFGKCRGQPFTYFLRNGLRLQLREVVASGLVPKRHINNDAPSMFPQIRAWYLGAHSSQSVIAFLSSRWRTQQNKTVNLENVSFLPRYGG